MGMISTTRLAKKVGLDGKTLFRILRDLELVQRVENRWELTPKGESFGGGYNKSESGRYVVWPEQTSAHKMLDKHEAMLMTATEISKHFETSPQKINKIIAELGWCEKQIDGWKLTKQGEDMGGFEFESSMGSVYLKWNKSILKDKGLINWFDPNDQEIPTENISSQKESLNKRYPPKYYTKDGHHVRSLSEKSIDDFLYMNGVVHAYERSINTDDGSLIPDFYIPAGAKGNSRKAYIEFWGMSDKEDYNRRKEEKLQIYKKLGLLDQLIQLEPAHLSDLDSHLGKMLLKIAHIQLG